MFTVLFWKDAGERAISTAAQVLVALWGADTLFNILTIDVGDALGIAAGAAGLSLLKSLAATRKGDPESASLTKDVGTPKTVELFLEDGTPIEPFQEPTGSGGEAAVLEGRA